MQAPNRLKDAGKSAPLIVEYHACAEPAGYDAPVSILCDGKPQGILYESVRDEAGGRDGILPESAWGERSSLLLAGYSAGCRGVRTQLLSGVKPDAVIAIDGIHGNYDLPDYQLTPWMSALDRAKRGESLFLQTATRVPTFDYLSTLQMAEILWGRRALEDTVSYSLGGVSCRLHVEGRAFLCLFDAGSAEDHVLQGQVVLPSALTLALREMAGENFPSKTPLAYKILWGLLGAAAMAGFLYAATGLAKGSPR